MAKAIGQRQDPSRHKWWGQASTLQEVHGRITLNLEVSRADEWSAIAKVIFRNGQRSYDTDCDAQTNVTYISGTDNLVRN